MCESRAVAKWSKPIRRPLRTSSRLGHTGLGAGEGRPSGWEIIDEGTHHRRCRARRGPRSCRVDAPTGATKHSDASITVWLQVDAQSGWPGVVAAANAAFQKQHPGVAVNVQYQTWGTHLGKFDATLAGGNAPDVIEMGNTEMTKYMAAGAFQDLTSPEVVVRQLEQLARGPRRVRAGTTASSTACRTTRARASSPTGPTSSRRPGSRSAPKSLAQFTADAGEAEARSSARRATRRSTSPARTGTSR